MLSVLNLFHLGSTEHFRVPCTLPGTEARAMIKICLLFCEVHIWQGITQGHFIVLCPVWWQFQEHVSRRPQKTLMTCSRSSGHTWRILISEGFGPWDRGARLGMTPSAAPPQFSSALTRSANHPSQPFSSFVKSSVQSFTKLLLIS